MLKTFGEKMKILRQKNRHSLPTAAGNLNITLLNYTKMERSTDTLSLARILEICKIYDISSHEFLTTGEPEDEITEDNYQAVKKTLMEQGAYIVKLQKRIIYLEEELRVPR